MSSVVSVERRASLAVVTIDNPPVNALSARVRAALLESITALSADREVRGLLIACQGRTFAAGADISEFGAVPPPTFREVFAAIESCSRPVLVALHGTALGAGVELALACHYRCATRDARLGLPELTLGLIPGAGGTQRLPRLVGARAALEMIFSAAPVGATAALSMGLIDRIVEGELLPGALAYLQELVDSGAGPRPTRERSVDTKGFDAEFRAKSLASAAKRMRGQEAPKWAADAIAAATCLSFDEGLRKEAEIAHHSEFSAESKALRHLFFAERAVSRVPGLPESIVAKPIGRAGVIGAGTMGGGIAVAFADAGIGVDLVESSPELLERGLARIRSTIESSAARGRITGAQAQERMALIQGSLALDRLASADLIVEAVFEDLALKKRIFRELGRVARSDAVLASNTSTLDLNEIALESGRAEDVVGLHFFSPANVMRLLEIVRGSRTSPQTLATAIAVGKKLRKVGVVVGVCYGFAGNRMMMEGYLREADQLLLEGATPEQVDRVVEAYGFAMGPFVMSDMAGNDVGFKARETVGIRAHRPAPYHEVTDELARLGRLGQKTGSGFYRYEPGDRTPHPDPEVIAVTERLAQRFGVRRRSAIPDDEVAIRCVYPLINEGARILEEGIAARASDLDVIWTTGYGFPRFRGGPMFYADTLGVSEIYAQVARLHSLYGDYWKPAPLLRQLAEGGSSFAEWDAANAAARTRAP
jgi:3-hydroxyacyl-CoA dehydrogenase